MNSNLNEYEFHSVANAAEISRKHGIRARTSKKTGSAVILVTPAIAQDWLEYYAYERQRPAQPSWVRYLATEMSEGAFCNGTPLWFAKCGSQYFLIDGQNRLLAVALSEVPAVFSVILSTVRTLDEVAELYTIIDNNGVRSLSQRHTALGTAEAVGLNRTQIAVMDRAVRLIYTGFTSRTRVPVRITAPWIKKWAPYAHEYFQAIAGGEAARYMRKGPVVATGVLGFCWQPEKAEKFWHQVSHDDGLRVGDPRKALHRWIMENPDPRGRWKDARSLQSLEIGLHLAQAWNAFLWNDRLMKVSVKNLKSNLLLAGTPYNTDTTGYGLSAESYKLAA